jgi:DNA-binding transcriptional MocR family regulator
MTTWTPQLAAGQKPVYRAIADALSADLAAGRLAPGTRLPTHRDLAWALGVTVGTVSRAYAEAERRGLTFGEVGRGTFLRGPAAAEQYFYPESQGTEAGVIEMGFAYPAPADESQELSPILTALAAPPQPEGLFGYQSYAGTAVHRAAGAAWVARRGFTVAPEQITLTGGGQHAMLVALAALTRPGDRILTECLTYPGLQAAARLLGLKPEGLPMDAHGLCPEALDAACRSGSAKALYCLPVLHNPTNVTMPEARRQTIAEIARRHQLPVVEDDVYGLLPETAPPALCSYLPDLGFYISSLSKTVSPGLRVGYLAAPAWAAAQVNRAQRGSCWMGSPLTAEIATRLVTSGAADRLLRARREEARARARLAERLLGNWDLRSAAEAIHLWLLLPEPWRAAEFTEEAQREGVNITPADTFAVGRQAADHAVRICLGPPRDRQELEKGLARLRRLLQDGPSGCSHGIV